MPAIAAILIILLLAPDLTAGAEPESDGWMMRSHDGRRTGRADVNGPRRGLKVWTYVAEDGVSVNMEAAVTREGVFFGTWGLSRRQAAEKTAWDKFDGRIYGLNPASGQPLWSPLHPGHTPYAYAYAGRATTPQDGPAGKGLHWNFFNGTVEGTPAIDPRDGTLYVGRGDGKLYAVNPRSGQLKWTFRTSDPARPDDPEGGGEIIGGPLLTPEGVIVVATWAAPHRPDPPKHVRNETNAVYAVNRAGKMLWRYPETGTLESPFVAPAALSPDGTRVYVITGLPDPKWPCALYALEMRGGRLAWQVDLGSVGGQDMAVGIDGTIFVVGADARVLGSKPTAFAVTDQRNHGVMKWGPVQVDGLRPPMHMAGGLALFEAGGKVRDVFVSSTMLKDLNGKGAQLHRLNPENGEVTATWDPEQAVPACSGMLTDISLDRDGMVYVGVRGRWSILAQPEVHGRMYCLKYDGRSFDVVWSHEVAGQIDWASPAIGPDGGLYFGSTDRMSPLLLAISRGAQENVPDADPVFYGIRD